MARLQWAFRAVPRLSMAGKRRVGSPVCAAIALACVLPMALPASPAVGQEGGQRLSFTGTFRYEPLPTAMKNALHLPPAAVPIAVPSRRQSDVRLPASLPRILPRALLGSARAQGDQPFATHNRSTLGVANPARTGPATAVTGSNGSDANKEADRTAREFLQKETGSGRDDDARSAALTRDDLGPGALPSEAGPAARTRQTDGDDRLRTAEPSSSVWQTGVESYEPSS